jgi:ABC-type phosphate transport system substrate-binding protein
LREAWFKDFGKQNKAVTVDYQAKSSGARIQDFTNRTVDFGGSDAAMTDEEIAKVADDVVLLPVTAGEIVLAYNLPGSPKGLKLPRDVYPDIFLGKITKWNDPRIAAANPNLKLPDLLITVVRRSDSSGTTCVHKASLGNQRSDRQGGRLRNDGPVAKERQDRGRTKKRRDNGDDQANARRDRLHRIRLCQADQSRLYAAAEQGRPIHPGGHPVGPKRHWQPRLWIPA